MLGFISNSTILTMVFVIPAEDVVQTQSAIITKEQELASQVGNPSQGFGTCAQGVDGRERCRV